MKTLAKMCYAVICIITISLTACKKSAQPQPFDNDPRATQTLKYLTQSPWKETKLEYQQQDGTWIEKPLPSSITSVSNVFSTNGTYVIYNSDGSVQSSGIYDIIGDNTQLALNKSISYDFSILNDTTMQLTIIGQIPYTDPASNITYTYFGMRQTFSH